MAVSDPTIARHLVSHLELAYDPEHLALRLSLPAEDIQQLSPQAQELFLETVVTCWKRNCPEWRLEELLLTLQREES